VRAEVRQEPRIEVGARVNKKVTELKVEVRANVGEDIL
jgi:hypothetical protein